MNTLSSAERRIFLSLARKRQKPGTGSSQEFLSQRTAHFRWPDLHALLAPVQWATIGAVATRHYMPERVTHVLDIVVAAADAPAVRERLAEAGYQFRGALRIGRFSWLMPEGIPLDVLEGREQWCPEAIREAQTNRDAQGLPILPLPYLVLIKFQSGRVQDLADIARMLGQADEATLARTREPFANKTVADREDLESLIALGRREMMP